MIIRPALRKDISAITKIAIENSLAHLSDQEINQSGFLVSAYSEADYIKFLNNQHFYLVEDNRQVIAFILTFTREELDYNQRVNQEVLKKCDEEFLVIKQVCISKQFTRKGIGNKLYRYIIQNIGIRNYFAAIVYDPMNDVSIKFHQSMGFTESFTITPEDKIPRGIFYYQKAQANEKLLTVQTEQYTHALDLYKHEDRLNWLKFNNLIYLNAGVFAIMGFLIKQDPNPIILDTSQYLTILRFLPFLGVIISLVLGESIRSGVRYLMDRKLKVIEIEKNLISIGGLHVVSNKETIVNDKAARSQIRNLKKLENSVTTLIFKNISWVFILFWILLFIFIYTGFQIAP